MGNNLNYIYDNFRNILEKIEVVKKENGIKENISIVAVTKTFSIEYIVEAYKSGIRIFGENKVQEAISKIEELKNKNIILENVSWHMIGNLQTNKVKKTIEYFDFIQSIDRESLVDEISKKIEYFDKKIKILFEVNISEEPQKGGVLPDNLFKLIDYTLNKKMKNIEIKGLMTVGTFSDDLYFKEKEFEKMKKIFDNVRQKYGDKNFEILSMGMSNDYLIAIKHGANMVRIGTALFGNRNYNL